MNQRGDPDFIRAKISVGVQRLRHEVLRNLPHTTDRRVQHCAGTTRANIPQAHTKHIIINTNKYLFAEKQNWINH